MCDWTEWQLIAEREKLEKARAEDLKRLHESRAPVRKPEQEPERKAEPQPDAVPV